MLQVLEQYGDVEPFLQENSDLSPATQSKLLDILHNPQSLTTFKLELAAVVDMGVHFVKATYCLEGDGLLYWCATKRFSKSGLPFSPHGTPTYKLWPRMLFLVTQAYKASGQLMP